MINDAGIWAPVLHAHLPFVRHPEYVDMMEERWLYEAITETYIPLIDVFQRLSDENIKFRLTLTITPSLANMLADSLLMGRYLNYINRLVDLAENEVLRTKDLAKFELLARIYRDKFYKIRSIFEKWNFRLLNAFRHFQDSGYLEIITCCATHAFLPLLANFKEAVEAQIKMAVIDYEHHFRRAPKGIWLAECAYYEGVDEVLRRNGLSYFFVDTHGITHANPRPGYSTYAPIDCGSGVFAFGRDPETGRQVWSSEVGYPGDPNYRDFYRDIGFDLDKEYIGPYIHESGIRLNTGIKYHRITGKNIADKDVYDYSIAMQKTWEHANHFVFSRERQIAAVGVNMRRSPIIVSPYDCELFGHWWFEGPEFLYNVLKKIVLEGQYTRLGTPSDYLGIYKHSEKAVPSMSSWGEEGYCSVWLNEKNAWIYPHVHKATERMIKLANDFFEATGLMQRALNQAAREVMLLQSSDWAFIMKTETTVGYAKKRIKDHVFRFNKLYESILGGDVNVLWLSEVESRDNIFPEMDFRIFKKQ